MRKIAGIACAAMVLSACSTGPQRPPAGPGSGVGSAYVPMVEPSPGSPSQASASYEAVVAKCQREADGLPFIRPHDHDEALFVVGPRRSRRDRLEHRERLSGQSGVRRPVRHRRHPALPGAHGPLHPVGVFAPGRGLAQEAGDAGRQLHGPLRLQECRSHGPRRPGFPRRAAAWRPDRPGATPSWRRNWRNPGVARPRRWRRWSPRDRASRLSGRLHERACDRHPLRVRPVQRQQRVRHPIRQRAPTGQTWRA